MKTYSLLAIAIILCMSSFVVQSQVSPRWMQQSAVSPDGKWIAFEYQTKLWKVPFKGGMAIPLTSDSTYSGYPVWSHDSKTIAYAAYKQGNFDVFVMSAEGGRPKRLTTHSSRDIPYDFSVDDSCVLFGAVRNDVSSSVRFPSSFNFVNLYEVNVKGGRSILISSAGMDKAKLNRTGELLLFQDCKGRENKLRKYQTSSVTRDIWTFNLKDKAYKKVTGFYGDDLDPVWAGDSSFYYLSERKGSLNIYKGNLKDSTKVTQLSHFKDYPVRNLSITLSGDLAFTYNGDLYTLRPGGEPKKLKVVIPTLPLATAPKVIPVAGEISEMTVSKDGKQIAFVSRGELFVSSADGVLVARLTTTPYQERMPEFSPDGKKLLYSVERGTSWDIEQLCIKAGEQAYFYQKPNMTREVLIATDQDEFQGVYAPDGTQIAYVENRDVLKTYRLSDKKTRLLLPEGVNYSGKDGDQYFRWSPDGQSLLLHSKEGTTGYDQEVLLVKNDGSGKYTNLTRSGFKDDQPQWANSGKMFYWLSDKDSYRNFTEDSEKNVFAMYFDTKPGLNREGEMERKRLTNFSGDIAACAMTPDENRLYYLGKAEDSYDLMVADLKADSKKLFVKLGMWSPKMEMTMDGRHIFILNDGDITRIDLDSAKVTKLKIDASVAVNIEAERAYIFDHMFQLLRKRFMYPAGIASVVRKNYLNYKEFVKHTTNDYDFSIMVNEFLGELNTSHTGAWGGINSANSDDTGALGLLYDETWRADGLLVKEVISGGPFDLKGSKMRADVIVTMINGINVGIDSDWSSMLNHRSGKLTEVVFKDLKSGDTYKETVKPISHYDEIVHLLQARWVRRMEHLTDSLSGGKVGYVYVKIMMDPGMRDLYDKALGKYRNAEALIVDTRFNQGGSLHDELTTFLNGKIYLTEHRQDRVTPSGEPFKKWTKPSVMLMCEGNYSDAYLTPYTYKLMGIGKLIGMPVPGTGTASQGEVQINKNIGFHFATAATYFRDNPHANENFQLEPDIKVQNEYNKVLNGEDEQLKRAVVEMLNAIKK